MIAAGIVKPVLDARNNPKRDRDGKPIVVPEYTGLHTLRHFFASWWGMVRSVLFGPRIVWLRRTNVWHKATSPARRAERLRSGNGAARARGCDDSEAPQTSGGHLPGCPGVGGQLSGAQVYPGWPSCGFNRRGRVTRGRRGFFPSHVANRALRSAPAGSASEIQTEKKHRDGP